MKSAFGSWSDVRVFLAVVREGSTLAASRKLGLAQPTVARRIDVLEHELGLVLFQRDTQGFKPNADARALLPLAETIERAAFEFGSTALGLARPKPVRVTAPGAFSETTAALFSEFSARYPNVDFEFLPGVKPLDLMAGEADIAFRIVAKPPDDRLICRRISMARWALFGSPDYANRFGLPGSVGELAGHRFVSFRHDDVPPVLHDWLLRHVARDQIAGTYSEIDLMLASVRAGHGLGLINLRMAEGDSKLIRCFEDIAELARPNLMLIAPEAYKRPEVRAFTSFFAPRYAASFR
jgi:DNA-binding transcriptional LysR family regulator